MEELATTAAEAQRYFDEGNIAVAEMIARAVVTAPTAAAQPAAARPASADDIARARDILARCAAHFGSARLAAPPDGRTRFLLIKAWGNGFWSDVDHVVGGLLLAQITRRIPVVHWGENSRFRDGPGDAFRLYFEPLNDRTLDSLRGKGLSFWPPKWSDDNLDRDEINKLGGDWSRLPGVAYFARDEDVAVLDYHTGVPVLLPHVPAWHPLHAAPLDHAFRTLLAQLRPRPEILAQAEAFARANFGSGGGPIIAVHARGSDKHVEDPQLDAKLAALPRIIDAMAQYRPGARVFLLTDSSPVAADFAARYGPRLITTPALRTDAKRGLHYQDLPRRRLATEVLIDALLAARCNAFVGLGSSNVACAIVHLKKWLPQDLAIIGPLLTHLPNPFLYMNHDQLGRYIPADQLARLRAYAHTGRLDDLESKI
ncbi:MAG: hypothetical protein JNM80_03130 [Phycisphaerae bacterium]|nr:hypothetical protein [Phycisphaerae bacterium]